MSTTHAKPKKWKSKGPAFPKDCLPVAIRQVPQPDSLFSQAISVLNPFQGPTAEEITAKRRAERQKFKDDRAQAFVTARERAEQSFNSRNFPSLSRPMSSTINRQPPETTATYAKASGSVAAPLSPNPKSKVIQISTEDTPPLPPVPSLPPTLSAEDNQMEHLQLTLQEAFFLAWSLGCLRVLDPATDRYLSARDLLQQSLRIHIRSPSLVPQFRTDNPFMVHYAVYHHYRSLGWVIRGGIKFCVDYLLYKKGPPFQHAEFGLVVCPVYEDPEDRKTSPFNLQNVDPMSWSWFSTINRVNSQVKKTLVLTYVTIPAVKRVSSLLWDDPTLFTQYSVREVVVRRWIPARMRD